MRTYQAPIKIRHTGTPAAGEPVWSMRLKDDATVLVKITKMYIVVGFDGTAAATSSSYVIEKHDTATATGGAEITVMKMLENQPATEVTDVRDDYDGSGLTDTSFNLLGEIVNIGCPRGITGGFVVYNLKNVAYLQNRGDVVQGEGLSITTDEAGVIGDTLRGYVEWTETKAPEMKG
jgi:hypothetical protein